jgi:uncharacterized zinc-type alcohol dehydrogenase-like protein
VSLKTLAIIKKSKESAFVIGEIERKDLDDQDVLVEILYCGICHSDVHVAYDEWKKTMYPVVPGHEILGIVRQVGKHVSKLHLGQIVGIGCIIGSCKTCRSCQQHEEQYCDEGFVLVFNSLDPKSHTKNYGGFSKHIVVDQNYAIPIPQQFSSHDLAKVAPLLCAGITTFSPLHHWKIKKGMKVGILGIGGLGHMAIKIALAMGAEVIGLTHSQDKIQRALDLGATNCLITSENALQEHANTFDFILSTVSSEYDLNPMLNLLKKDGTLCLVGLPEKPYSKLEAGSLIHQRRSLSGSLIGSIEETKLMLDFCAKHHILADIELIEPSQVTQAMESLKKGALSHRFVIDMQQL